MRVRVFSFSFVCTPYGCWVAGVGHPVSQNVKVVLSQNGVHGYDIHAILMQYAPPESLKNAYIAGLCCTRVGTFSANQASTGKLVATEKKNFKLRTGPVRNFFGPEVRKVRTVTDHLRRSISYGPLADLLTVYGP